MKDHTATVVMLICSFVVCYFATKQYGSWGAFGAYFFVCLVIAPALDNKGKTE